MGTITTTAIEQGDNLTTGEYAHTISRSPEPLSPLSPIRQSTDSYSRFSVEGSSQPNLESPTTTFSGTSNSPTTARDRLTSAIRSVMMLQSATSSPSSPFSPVRKRTTSSALTDASRTTPETGITTTFRGSKVASLISKLKSLETTQDLAAHSALVRHLQFSPNGKFLATSRYDLPACGVRCVLMFLIAGIGRPSSSALGCVMLVVD